MDDSPHGPDGPDGAGTGDSNGAAYEHSAGANSGHPGGHPGARDYSEAPLVVTWETTRACALSCDHCRAEATPDRAPRELTTAEARDLFESVASFSPTPILVLSGGDPLERPDLFDLVEAAVDAGLTPSVTPATTEALTPEVVERFAAAGVGRMALSLDGASAAAHDGFRGEDGTFERALSAAEHAREVGLPIQFNTTVTADTVEELPGIADLAERYDAAMWEVFFLVPVGRGAHLDQLAPDEARETMAWLYRRARRAPYRVITVEAPFYRRVAREVAAADGDRPPRVGSTGAGNGFVFVDHCGNAFPSGFLPVPVGNVRETPLPELYREAPLMRRLRDRSSFAGPCGDCPATETCGGSRSRAHAVTGDPTGSDPLCPWAVGSDGAAGAPGREGD